VYEAVKALITETSLVEFVIITIQQNFILLPTFVVYEMPLHLGISHQASNIEGGGGGPKMPIKNG
jgi:hypothetical protein